ncbi:MAG: alpha/beta fold hydrolase [Synechococcus sp.]
MQSSKPSRSPSDQSPAAAVQFYQWKNFRCAYEIHEPKDRSITQPPLLLIHPIGVGLARPFWHRFCAAWHEIEPSRAIYNPDLLGCGDSDMPAIAYRPLDWAEQLLYFIESVIEEPVIVVAQGALMPVALELVQPSKGADWIAAQIWSGPPAWSIVSQTTAGWQQTLAWSLFQSPLGNGFYRYARREAFLQSFSQRKLFAETTSVDREWLDQLHWGSRDMASRHAVFAFLAGFWRKDYRPLLANMQQPTYVVFGEQASSISRTGQVEPAGDRLNDYLECLPQANGCVIPGRNVLPYENSRGFVTAISPFVREID